jgi:transcriptional regulator GlxA family with amidase domain
MRIVEEPAVSARRIGLVVYPDFQIMCFVAFSVFEVANKEAGTNLYELEVLSDSKQRVRSSFGSEISCAPLRADGFDTLMIGVGMAIPPTLPRVTGFLRDAARSTRRIASICLGSFVLGDAGLLDGRRATTHWNHGDELRRRYPRCEVELDRIYVNDGQVWTSAGMSASTDLALGLVEQDHGRDLARTIARGMVVHHRRNGGQSQHSTLLDLDARSDRVQTVLAYARRNLRRPLSLGELAEVANVSPRQFTRVFRGETGHTPAQAITMLRLEQARALLSQSRLSIEAIARDTGFGDPERMRRAFVRFVGEPPLKLRRAAGAAK